MTVTTDLVCVCESEVRGLGVGWGGPGTQALRLFTQLQFTCLISCLEESVQQPPTSHAKNAKRRRRELEIDVRLPPTIVHFRTELLRTENFLI